MEQQNSVQGNENMQNAVSATQNQAAQNQNPYYANAPQQTNQNPYAQNTQNDNSSLFGFLNNAEFLKGALIGAAAGYLLTNEKAQKAIFKTLAKGTQAVQMGVEEMKERFEDAKAEMESK